MIAATLTLAVITVKSQNYLFSGIVSQLYDTLTPNPYLYWDVLSHNSNGWLIEYQDSVTKNWDRTERRVIKTDARNRILLMDYQLWLKGELTWASVNKESCTVEENNQNQIEKVSSFIKRFSYPFDTYFDYHFRYTNNRLDELDIFWDESKKPTTSVGLRTFFKYNSIGQRVQDSTIAFPSMINQLKTDFGYDNKGRVIKKLSQRYIYSNSTLFYIDSMFWEYEFDASDRITSIIEYSGNPLKLNRKQTYTYNTNSNVDESVVYFGSFGTNNDTLARQNFYKQYFDKSNRLVAVVERTSVSSWENVDSIAITYRPDGSYDSAFIYPGVNQTNWSSNYNRRLSFYNLLSLPVETVNKTETKIVAYPNPTSSALNISFTPQTSGSMLFSLTDIRGKQIHTEMVNCVNGVEQNTKIDISHLPSGLYFLKVGTKTLKIIKE